jgi:hypothetical protein
MPFEEKLDNQVELFNESCILLLFTFLLIYTDTSSLSPQTASNLGFALIGLILFNIAINVMLFLYSNAKLIY